MSTAARQERLLEEVLRQPGNDVCADCKASAPRWASVNLGIFLCVQCASVHRKMGTHTSRVKSVTMDLWKREDVEAMRAMGNIKANAVANPDEARNPPPTSTSDFADRDSQLEKYIRRKWELGTFRARASSSIGASNGRPSGNGTLSASSSSSRLDPQGYSRTKTTPLPELPPPSPEASDRRSPAFGSSSSAGRVKDPGAKTVARQHVQSNWDDFSSFAEDAVARELRVPSRQETERPVLTYKSTTPRDGTPAAAAPPAPQAPSTASNTRTASLPIASATSQPSLIDTSLPSATAGPPPIIATPTAWPQPPGWPGQSYAVNGGAMNGSYAQPQQAFNPPPAAQLSPGNPFLQYQATGMSGMQATSPFQPQGPIYGMQQHQPVGMHASSASAFPAQAMPFQQQGQVMGYPASGQYQQYATNGFTQTGMPAGGAQSPFGQYVYSQQYQQGQQMMPQGWGMR